MQDSRTSHWNTNYSKGKDFGLIPSSMVTKILSYTNPTLAKSCLDIGCGTGQLTRELYHHGYTCTGIDISDEAISLAQQNTIYNTSLQYIQADAEIINQVLLPQKTYSLITCKLVYAFINNKHLFLESIRNLLDADGMFVVITPINKDDERSPIAVNFNETKTELAKFFPRIDTFDGLGVTYFICSN